MNLPMNLREFAAHHLRQEGFDGLFNAADIQCACLIGDLMPCDTPGIECTPGYKVPCDGACDDPDICQGHLAAHKPESPHAPD